MTAWVRLVAAFVHQIDALWFAAYVSKSCLRADRGLSERLPAESALESNSVLLSFFTAHSDVIWLFLAACAEVFSA